jgi:hypothetical protein
MSRFWPPAEPPQHVYERLRSAVLASGRLPDELAAARFARRGLAGLIIWPDAEPVFSADLIGAARAGVDPLRRSARRRPGRHLPAAARQHRASPRRAL